MACGRAADRLPEAPGTPDDALDQLVPELELIPQRSVEAATAPMHPDDVVARSVTSHSEVIWRNEPTNDGWRIISGQFGVLFGLGLVTLGVLGVAGAFRLPLS